MLGPENYSRGLTLPIPIQPTAIFGQAQQALVALAEQRGRVPGAGLGQQSLPDVFL